MEVLVLETSVETFKPKEAICRMSRHTLKG